MRKSTGTSNSRQIEVHDAINQPTSLTMISRKPVQTVTRVIADAIYTRSIVSTLMTDAVIDV